MQLTKKLKQQLVKTAIKVAQNSYSPYSKYKVGAAVLCQGEEVFASCNSEVATLGLCDCGEFSAISKAIGEGMYKKYGRKFLKAVAVVTADGGMPCGRCRQKMLEHCDNCVVITADYTGKIRTTSTAKKLLPNAFGPDSLGVG